MKEHHMRSKKGILRHHKTLASLTDILEKFFNDDPKVSGLPIRLRYLQQL